MSVYSQIYLHIIFAVKGREAAIQQSWEAQLYSYITGIIRNKGQKLLAINGMPNHIHLAISINPECCVADLVREIKKSSNAYVNNEFVKNKSFKWQKGYGVFSFGKSQLDTVTKYIMRQKSHHSVKPFKEEFIEFIQAYGIEYVPKYFEKWFEEVDGGKE